MTHTPLEMLDAYVRAFETLRAEEVVPFYELPCTFLRPDGVWVVQDAASALVLAAHLRPQATERDVAGTTIGRRPVDLG